MAEQKTRGPKFPSIDLKSAIEEMRPVFEKETFNKMSRDVLADHLGYSGISGASTSKIGALRHYGLIEGSGDELKVSEDTATVLMGDPEIDDLNAIKKKLARKPALFSELLTEFSSKPSPQNLEFMLVKRGLLKNSAKKAADVFLSTMDFAKLWDEGNAPTEPSPNEIDGQDRTGPEPLERAGPITSSLIQRIRNQRSHQQSGQRQSDEKQIASGLLSKSTTFRLLVSGPLGEAEFEMLLKKLALDKEILMTDEPDDDLI